MNMKAEKTKTKIEPHHFFGLRIFSLNVQLQEFAASEGRFQGLPCRVGLPWNKS